VDSLPKFKPHEHQRIGAEFILNHPRCTLVADPGMGKTGIALMVIDLLKLVGSSFFPVLILAPKRVAEVVWTGERDRWSTFQDISMIQVLGDPKAREAALREPVADVYICTYDLAPWLVEQWTQERWPFKTVIADESSRLKSFRLHQGGKRTQALSNIAKVTGRWINLTGTPMPNGPIDLWGSQWFIDFGEALKRSFTAYKEAYFIENQYSHKITLQHGAEAAIHEALKPTMLALRAEDWLDITQPQIIPVEFEMPPAAREQYRRMEKEFFVEVNDAAIEAGTAAIKSSKLLQMCAGSIIDTETGDTHEVHNSRLEALDDVLEQIEPAPLLVSYWWKSDPPRILAHLARKKILARLYGGKKDETDWNARKFRVMLLQEQSAFGLNLHEPCRDILHYSYTWSAELWQQMVERVGPARQAQAGKKAAVRVWYAIAKGTVDRDVIDSNFGKITVEQALKRARARSRNEKT
jgi:SNF2 family DNA or RNA helicase